MSNPIASSSSKLIWLVENQIDRTSLLKSVLEKWRYETITISDPQAFCLQLDSCDRLADLIIVNLTLGQNNYDRLIAAFRQNETASKVPILCLSPINGPSQSQIMASGANAYLNKPFELKQFHLQLKKLTTQTSQCDREMTLLFSATESSRVQSEQEYWLKVFQENSAAKAGELLRAAGYQLSNLEQFNSSRRSQTNSVKRADLCFTAEMAEETILE